MQTKSTELFRISQGHLNLLATCPRKFQHTYLEKITIPINPQNEKYQILGSRFHLLMQQQEMGLPIDSLKNTDDQLENWINDFNHTAPEILNPKPENQNFRESEHYRTLQIQDYLITVIYDLLILEPDQAKIFDWKTYREPLKKDDLVKNWQTKLYMYVLAETSDYLPNNISMTYWFVQSQNKHKNITINYSLREHQKTEQKLTEILNKLTNWLTAYHQNRPFPQQTISQELCNKCQYNSLCYNLENNSLPDSEILSNIATIEEISI